MTGDKVRPLLRRRDTAKTSAATTAPEMASETPSDGGTVSNRHSWNDYLAQVELAERTLADYHKARISAELRIACDRRDIEAKRTALNSLRKEANERTRDLSPARQYQESYEFSEEQLRTAIQAIAAWKNAYQPGMFKKAELKLRARAAAAYIVSSSGWFDEQLRALDRLLVTTTVESERALRTAESNAKTASSSVTSWVHRYCTQSGLSPLGHPTINLHGRYRTTTRAPSKGLRPLRSGQRGEGR